MFHSTRIWITFFQFCLDLKPSPNQRLNVHFAGSKHIPCWPSLGLLSCKFWLSQRCDYPLQHFRFHISTVWVWTNFNHAAQVASCAKVLTANGAANTNSLTARPNRPRLGSPTTMRPRGHALKPPVARNSHGRLAHICHVHSVPFVCWASGIDPTLVTQEAHNLRRIDIEHHKTLRFLKPLRWELNPAVLLLVAEKINRSHSPPCKASMVETWSPFRWRSSTMLNPKPRSMASMACSGCSAWSRWSLYRKSAKRLTDSEMDGVPIAWKRKEAPLQTKNA